MIEPKKFKITPELIKSTIDNLTSERSPLDKVQKELLRIGLTKCLTEPLSMPIVPAVSSERYENYLKVAARDKALKSGFLIGENLWFNKDSGIMFISLVSLGNDFITWKDINSEIIELSREEASLIANKIAIKTQEIYGIVA